MRGGIAGPIEDRNTARLLGTGRHHLPSKYGFAESVVIEQYRQNRYEWKKTEMYSSGGKSPSA